MFEIKTTSLRSALEFYHSFQYLLCLLQDNITKQSPIQEIGFTTKGLYDMIEFNRDDYEPQLPNVIDEIRANILNLNNDGVKKYRTYVSKYIADYDGQFFSDIVLLKNAFLAEAIELKGKELELKLYDLIFQAKEIKTKEEAIECLRYALHYFIISWGQLKLTVEKEFESEVGVLQPEALLLEPQDEENTQTLSVKQKILLLQKVGFFDLPMLQNIDLTKIAALLTPLLDRNYKNIYDAIRERHSLEKSVRDSNSIANILNRVKPD